MEQVVWQVAAADDDRDPLPEALAVCTTGGDRDPDGALDQEVLVRQRVPHAGSDRGLVHIHEAIHEVLWPAWSQSQHVTSNLVVEFTGPDSASGLCDVDCMGLLTDSTEATFVGATYKDSYARRDGIWRISEREVTIHYFNQFAGTTLSAPEG